MTVASRRLVDRWRSERARADAGAGRSAGVPEPGPAGDRDDSLTLLLLCCHPALTRPSQVALTLRAVAGLSTAQIARGFLVPEATMAQRISRAKARLREVGAEFSAPGAGGDAGPGGRGRRGALPRLHRGAHRTTGGGLTDPSLSAEAIRLTRLLHGYLPSAGEVTGLLALMLLTDARRAARTRADGSLVLLAEQDRTLWDRDLIARGHPARRARPCPPGRSGPTSCRRRSRRSMPRRRTRPRRTGPRSSCSTGCCTSRRPVPAVTLNHAVAVAEVRGPAEALAMVEPLLADRKLRHDHRPHAVHAHLLERLGRRDEAPRSTPPPRGWPPASPSNVISTIGPPRPGRRQSQL